jgi:Asp-tRNA(Asn)/Glu-tRNA(Gln) amidotransferase A subunit family amidase
MTVLESPMLVKNFHIKYTNNIFSRWKKARLYEASKVHAKRLESNVGQFGSDVVKMLVEGTHITINEYTHAKKQIEKIKDEFMKVFKSGINTILLLTPVILAPKLRTTDIKIDDLQHNIRKSLLRNTVVFNSIGISAISIPLGFVSEKENMLPVILQIIGPPSGDQLVLFAANKIEELVGLNSVFTQGTEEEKKQIFFSISIKEKDQDLVCLLILFTTTKCIMIFVAVL